MYIVGFPVSTPVGLRTSRAMLLQLSVDLPARAMVTNTKQFNGKYGCLYCYNPGTTDSSNPLHRFWPHVSTECRTTASYLQDVANSVSGGDSVSIQYLQSALCASKIALHINFLCPNTCRSCCPSSDSARGLYIQSSCHEGRREEKELSF